MPIIGWTPKIEGDYGTTMPQPIYAEPAKAREPKNLDKRQLLKRQRWSEADFETACSCGEPCRFPAGNWGMPAAMVPSGCTWRDTDVDAWRARLADHVERLKKLL